MDITINEGLGLIKTLRQRHEELKALRSENANVENHYYGASTAPSVSKTPVYNIKALDKTTSRIALEIRKLDSAIKQFNATATLPNYVWDEGVLGVIETE